jgi:peptide/nickel transport system ATP-binding protein
VTGDLLRATGLRVALPDSARKRPFRRAPLIDILHGVDFRIARGEAVGIVGESGSGKTTLGRALLRLLEPTGGRIAFDGQDITHAAEAALRPLRARMTMIFQNPLSALNPRRTVAASVAAPLRARGDGGDTARLVGRALDRAGLPARFADRYPHQLSGGQRQRVGIARAIVTEPDFILADEIVSGLDVSTQAQVLDLLRELRRDMGLALAFIAHDLSVVRVLCERVIVMHLGRIVEEGDCAAMFAGPRHPYTRRLLAAIPLPELDEGWLDAEAEDAAT